MKKIKIISDKSTVSPKEAIELWVKLKWGTKRDYNEKSVKTALKNTSLVLSARDSKNKLVGLARIISDGVFNTSLADIVVDPDFQGKGIGARMMEIIKKRYRRTGIYIEAFKQNEGFFEKCGYIKRDNMIVYSKKFV